MVFTTTAGAICRLTVDLAAGSSGLAASGARRSAATAFLTAIPPPAPPITVTPIMAAATALALAQVIMVMAPFAIVIPVVAVAAPLAAANAAFVNPVGAL